jgi:hypothetical protein
LKLTLGSPQLPFLLTCQMRNLVEKNVDVNLGDEW